MRSSSVMEIKPLNTNELARLDKLTLTDLDWVKARIRALSLEVRRLQEQLRDIETLKAIKK